MSFSDGIAVLQSRREAVVEKHGPRLSAMGGGEREVAPPHKIFYLSRWGKIKIKIKKYSFRNEDVEDFFTSLLEQGLIELPEPKRPDEVGRVGDPKYC